VTVFDGLAFVSSSHAIDRVDVSDDRGPMGVEVDRVPDQLDGCRADPRIAGERPCAELG
jgi:hypothetical protein